MGGVRLGLTLDRCYPGGVIVLTPHTVVLGPARPGPMPPFSILKVTVPIDAGCPLEPVPKGAFAFTMIGHTNMALGAKDTPTTTQTTGLIQD